MSFVAICCVFVLIALISKKLLLGKPSNSPSPFLVTFDGIQRPLETDKDARNAVIKKGFKPEHVPKNLDAIVIGSGMGGLSCAGLLARSGKRVLVLEQHGRIGGCTHTYRHKGFEYDIGIHYVGNMEDGSMSRCLVDLLTDKQLKWEPTHEQYDTVVFDNPDGTTKSFPQFKGKETMKKFLIKHFPDDEKAIMQYFRLLKEASNAVKIYTLLKFLPLSLCKIVAALKLHKLFFRSYSRMSEKTLKQVVDEITDNKELKAVLTYAWGDYGCPPSRAPFMIHGMVVSHYMYAGGFYPHGGASEIAFQMVPGIEKAGGVVLARARVGEILFENGAACGVKLAKSTVFPDFEIKAPVVISDAGIYNTYHSLVPPHIRDEHGIMKDLDWIEPGMACTQVMVGLNGTSEELGLMSKNFWIFHGNDVEKCLNDYMAMSREDAVTADFPLVFVSFPSTKDSSWASRYPGKSTCVIVTFANKDWFEDWKEDGVKKRGQVYENLKSAFVDQLWSQVLRHFPQLENKVETIQCGTPLSHMHYLNSMHGEVYGTNHNLERFQFEHAMKNRPKTPIPGFYLTGQDMFTAGFMGAAFGGVLAASSVLDRNLLLDLVKNVKETRKRSSRKH